MLGSCKPLVTFLTYYSYLFFPLQSFDQPNPTAPLYLLEFRFWPGGIAVYKDIGVIIEGLQF